MVHNNVQEVQYLGVAFCGDHQVFVFEEFANLLPQYFNLWTAFLYQTESVKSLQADVLLGHHLCHDVEHEALPACRSRPHRCCPVYNAH